MAAGDVTDLLVAELGLRLEDSDNVRFPTAAKLTFLNKAQKTLCNLIHPAYLTELEEVETDLALTAQAYQISSLNSGDGVLKGAKGIIRIAVDIGGVTGNVWANQIDIREVKKMENPLLVYSDEEPRFYCFNDKINVLVATYTSTVIDVYYLKIPATMTTDVDPEINDSLHNAMTTLAEAYLWGTDSKLDRKTAAQDQAYQEIQALNDMYRKPEGVGTNRREYEEGK